MNEYARAVDALLDAVVERAAARVPYEETAERSYKAAEGRFDAAVAAYEAAEARFLAAREALA